MKYLLILTTVAILLFFNISSCSSYDTEFVNVEVTKGMTLWEICENHYSPKENRSFEEFLHDATERNKVRGRHLIIGEVISLELHKVR